MYISLHNMPDKRRLVTSEFPFITKQLVSWKHSYHRRALSLVKFNTGFEVVTHPILGSPFSPPEWCNHDSTALGKGTSAKE